MICQACYTDTGSGEDYGYCISCWLSGAPIKSAVAPTLRALEAAQLHPEVVHTGGGIFVVEIPISEDQRHRHMWIGWDHPDPTGYIEFHANVFTPDVGDVIGGYVYQLNPDVEDGLGCTKEPFSHTIAAGDDVAAIVRAWAVEAMQLPDSDVRWYC